MPTLRLNAVLGLNKTGFDEGMRRADAQVKGFAKGLAGAFSVAAIVQFTKHVINMGGEIKDAMQQLGVGAKDVQQFGLAAKLGGAGANTFATAIEKVRLAMVKGTAGEGNPLAQFGITVADLKSGDAPGVLRKLAAALETFNGSADQTKALSEVFGARGMGQVVRMLRELKGVNGALVMTDDEIEQLDRAGDAWTRFGNVMTVVGAKLLLPDPADSWLGRKLGMKKRGGDAAPVPIPVEASDAQMEKDAKAADDLAKVQQQTAEIIEKNRVSQLTDEERLNELFAERTELIRQLQFQLTEAATAAMQLRIAENAAAIIGLQGKMDGASANVGRHGSSISESGLGMIGAFSGGATQTSASTQALQSLRRIESALIQKGIIVRDTR